MQQYAIYSRKSRFTGKGESIENQIELCRQYIRVNVGIEEAENALIYEDEGFSGGTLERPQFRRMMDDARTKQFTAIVVYRLDRASRNIGDFVKLIEELNAKNIAFISIKEQFDTSSPIGRAMMYISSVFSQLERETIAERIRDNMLELAKSGRWLGGITPLGYQSEAVEYRTQDGKMKQEYRLKLVPKEADIVKAVFHTFIKTCSLKKTVDYLQENGYITKNHNAFTRFAVKGILTNPVYMIADEDAYNYFLSNNSNLCSAESQFDHFHGMMVYNRTFQQAGKSNRIRDKEDWVVAVSGHAGIISGQEWTRVQNLLAMNKKDVGQTSKSSCALLSGALLFCGNCGSSMRSKRSNRKKENGEFSYDYLCKAKEKSCRQACSIKNINGNKLDDVLLENIKLLPIDYNYLLSYLKKLRHISMKQFDKRQQEIILESKQYGVETGQSQFDELISKTTIVEKREIMRHLINKVIWDGKNIHVILFGSAYKYDFTDDSIPV